MRSFSFFFVKKKAGLLAVVETNSNVIDKTEHVEVVAVHVRVNGKSCTSSGGFVRAKTPDCTSDD